ncbi:MAG: lipid-A-disaccharide synthase N-terminal domain-containing protein [Gammaproteobacteria bacterium]
MSEQAWIIVGFIGQALFGTRFLIQWLTSERAKRSVIPRTFWYFSVGGSLVLLCYSLHKQDPVFIVGQIAGLFIYVRNLYLLHRVEKILALRPLRDDTQS